MHTAVEWIAGIASAFFLALAAWVYLQASKSKNYRKQARHYQPATRLKDFVSKQETKDGEQIFKESLEKRQKLRVVSELEGELQTKEVTSLLKELE